MKYLYHTLNGHRVSTIQRHDSDLQLRLRVWTPRIDDNIDQDFPTRKMSTPLTLNVSLLRRVVVYHSDTVQSQP